MTEKRKVQLREASKRWQKRHPEKVHAANTSDKARENNRKRALVYRAKNLELCRERTKRTYYKYQEQYKQKASNHRSKRRAILFQLKDKPCLDCGIKFHPCAMEFDHINKDKSFDVGAMFRSGLKLETIMLEVAKCELVCANCHRIREWNRRCKSQ
jgi:hypothetical protein